MTRRTRKLIVTVAALCATALTGGSTALAADGEKEPREQIRFVVTEKAECPESGGPAL
ncbi:hypothetical protein OHT76_08360 [Streptomyces sp. NBC_00287]|uniref:hypothetical protein n=1 Tax=Streptomyces sp. NBC_00287 TaxID=2975702 RepID=UPI002E2AD147|nr:hypothetical protein [Streptomyces sp. NBC_00287]